MSEGISIQSSGSFHRGGTRGYREGVGGQLFFPKFNQLWCVSCLCEWHVQRPNVLVPAPWGLWKGPKGQNFVCLLTNERYKTY